MLLRTRGIPLNFEADLVGRVTRNPDKLDELSFLLVDQEPVRTVPGPYLGMLTKQASVDDSYTQSVIYRVPTLDHLAEGDIVSVSQDGNINTLYRVNSPHNTLLATERCNSNCLMCSQPPKDKDDINRLFDVHQ
ncbi:MAG: His-Xaa-Ser system radical SAM maturase HxsC, partial [Pedobacter sp.]